MGTKLKGRNAVVTGAGRGIGQAVSLALAAEGASVVVVDPGVGRGGEGSDLTPADETVAEIKKAGGNAIASHESVTDFAAAEGIIKSCVDNFGRIDIMVNCAGVLRERMVFNMTEDEWDTVINVHLKGTFNMCRHASSMMKGQKYGRIINTTSDAWRGTVGQCNYSAAKGGIVSLTRSLARELGKYGITSNCIAPNAATRMTLTEEVKAGWWKRVEQGIWTKEKYEESINMPGPEFVAPVVAYLATEDAANINGQVFGCGGGRMALFSEPLEVRGLYKNYAEEGAWTLDELISLVPGTLLVGYINPAPPEAPKA